MKKTICIEHNKINNGNQQKQKHQNKAQYQAA